MTVVQFPDRRGQIADAKKDRDRRIASAHGSFKKWRVYRCMTLWEAATAMGRPPAALARAEMGAQPRLTFLQDMARVYECTLDELLQGPPSETGVA